MFENLGEHVGTPSQVGLAVAIAVLAYGLIKVLATKPLPGLLQRRGTVRTACFAVRSGGAFMRVLSICRSGAAGCGGGAGADRGPV